MAKTSKRLQQIFERYVDKTASESEKIELWDYINDPIFAAEIDELLGTDYARNHNEIGLNEGQKTEILQNIFEDETHQKTRTVRLWPRIAVAASILIIASLGIYFYTNKQPESLKNGITYANDIAPGKNGATLTLANGQKILVKDALAGKIATQSGVKISKTADGQIIYEITNDNSGEIAYNTLSTTRGEQTQVRLPDGTLVFLNAASSLRYPTTFENERRVELTGEAYLEVAHNKNKPFTVLSDGQEVKVLGTHFNVNSYTDEKDIRTTLLEGSVVVSSLRGTRQSKIIKPNEQTTLSKAGAITIEQANVDDVVAWTKGKFVFDQEDITSVMRKLSRWYNVELEYRGNLNGKTFTGSISRFDNISKILDKITYTDVIHFKIEGRRVIIMP